MVLFGEKMYEGNRGELSEIVDFQMHSIGSLGQNKFFEGDGCYPNENIDFHIVKKVQWDI